MNKKSKDTKELLKFLTSTEEGANTLKNLMERECTMNEYLELLSSAARDLSPKLFESIISNLTKLEITDVQEFHERAIVSLASTFLVYGYTIRSQLSRMELENCLEL